MRQILRSFILKALWVGALKRYHADTPTVIAVGGSVGKTSTKEAIALVLEKAGFRVVKTYGNMATDFGVALSLLGYTHTPATVTEWLAVLIKTWLPVRKGVSPCYYVLEYSTDSTGDTAFLTAKIPPHIAVLTTIVPVHMEQYGTEEAMIEETVSIIDALPGDGVIVANADDRAQRKALSGDRVKGRVVLWYGVETQANKLAAGVAAQKMGAAGMEVHLHIQPDVQKPQAKQAFPLVKTHVLGTYQLYPLLAAVAVAQRLGIDRTKYLQAVEGYELPSGRGRLIPGKNDITIIDDTANASPEAVKAGLSVLKPFAGKRRRVAILGTMNELGALSEEAHRDIARAAAKEAQSLVAVGKYAPIMVESAQAAGMPAGQVLGFSTPEQLLSHLTQVVQRKDVVYIKASQNGMYLERVVKALMAEPERAEELLVRQEAYWKTR